jgi:ABC-2 type transporter
VQKFTHSIMRQELIPPVQHQRKRDKANPFEQFYWLFSRYCKIKLNDKKNTAIMILQAPIIAILICLVFKEIKLAVLFLMSISAIWFGVNNSAREIVSEAAIYKRERMFNVLIFPYVFSKIIMLAAFAIMQSALFIVIISFYYRTGHADVPWDSTHILLGIFWMFFLTFCSSLLGLFISAASETTEKAMSVVPIIIIPQIMLAGVVTIIQTGLVELLSYFTISRWGTEGFTHIQKTVIDQSFDEKGIQRQYRVQAYDMMKKSFHESYRIMFGEHSGTFRLDTMILIFMSVLCIAGIWISLLKKDKAQF